MNILIIEDEQEAVERLRMFCSRYAAEHDVAGGVGIVEVLDSVKDAVAWFQSAERSQAAPTLAPPERAFPDLVLLDIHLADGLSFEIFDRVQVRAPIIFTTAYDQYALHAFKVNSIAYLLKPFRYADFVAAMDKLEQQKALFTAFATTPANTERRESVWQSALQEVSASVRSMQKRYKTRFMLHAGDTFTIVHTDSVAYVHAESKVVTLVEGNGRRHIADHTLEELEELLDPTHFFRISRKFIVRASAIATVQSYFNGRLALSVMPAAATEVLVSRERVRAFKAWLEGV